MERNIKWLKPILIGKRIDEEDKQLNIGSGYDHNYVLNSEEGDFAVAARVYEPESGRTMEVWTSEPGMQFYSGNTLTSRKGKCGSEYKPRTAFCLETQHYPDSPNQESFPDTILRPGDKYHTVTEYRFNSID
ncbi:MAG: hypothetical protein ACOCRZ_07710 [Halothermotrichaceae bacterium]